MPGHKFPCFQVLLNCLPRLPQGFFGRSMRPWMVSFSDLGAFWKVHLHRLGRFGEHKATRNGIGRLLCPGVSHFVPTLCQDRVNFVRRSNCIPTSKAFRPTRVRSGFIVAHLSRWVRLKCEAMSIHFRVVLQRWRSIHKVTRGGFHRGI